MDVTMTARIVPGAPPPAPLSKSQKKKRQTKRKPADSSVESSLLILPNTIDTENGVAAERSSAEQEVKELGTPRQLSQGFQLDQKVQSGDEVLVKPSPIVELVHKRLKATTKKIARITSYAAMDVEKLNDDQRRTLKTLPALEAVQKELAEVKKAVEVHETELAHELASKRAEAQLAEKDRLSNAVSETERSNVASTSDLLSFLRLHSVLAAGHPDALALNLDEVDSAAVFTAADILVGADGEDKQAFIYGFFSREGEFQDTTYARLVEITHQYLNPSGAAVPAEQEEPDDQDNPEMAVSLVSTVSTIGGTSDPDARVTDLKSKQSTGSFHFMQASELEPSFGESSTEWVEQADDFRQESDEATQARYGKDMVENGHPFVGESGLAPALAEEEDSLATSEGALDWAADDESGLPPIDGLHAKFGTPESATPAPATPVGELAAEGEEQQQKPDVNGASANGTSTPREGEEGFTHARGGRGGRARGDRGDRGYMRGGFRGGRGDHRGFRGFRGGDRGGYRGRSAPIGEWRSNGDGRVRGGRGRGGGEKGAFNDGRAPPPT